MTSHLGPVRYSAEDILTFPTGLPGFESRRTFVLLPHPDIGPLAYLQSIEAPGLRFILAAADAVHSSYSLSMEAWDRAVLFPDKASGEEPGGISSYFILCVSADGSPTVNMLAPVVIRWSVRRGVQAVRTDSRYSHAAPLILERPETKTRMRPC